MRSNLGLRKTLFVLSTARASEQSVQEPHYNYYRLLDPVVTRCTRVTHRGEYFLEYYKCRDHSSVFET